MIGQYTILPTSGGTFVATDQARVTVGIGLFASDAFAAGAGSMPDPSTDPAFPWLYHMDNPISLSVASADGNSVGNGVRTFYDIRTMRRIKPNESVGWVIQYTDVAGTLLLTAFFGRTRVLIGQR